MDRYGASVGGTGVQARLWMSIGMIGLVTALIELIPVLAIQAWLGTPPDVVFQSIAMSVLGKSAFSGGAAAAALGFALHVLVSIASTAIYVLVVQRRLGGRPIVAGLGYGVLAYVAMNFIVVPLSRIGFHLPGSFLLWAISFSVHLLAFGLPIALLSSWLADDTAAGLTSNGFRRSVHIGERGG